MSPQILTIGMVLANIAFFAAYTLYITATKMESSGERVFTILLYLSIQVGALVTLGLVLLPFKRWRTWSLGLLFSGALGLLVGLVVSWFVQGM